MAAQNVVVFGFWQREEGNKIELVSFAKVLWGDCPTMDSYSYVLKDSGWVESLLELGHGSHGWWISHQELGAIVWGMWGKSDSTEVLNEAKKALQLFDGVGVGQFTSPASLA